MGGKQSQYDIGLDKTPANYVPLTPLSFIARSAAVYPNHVSTVYEGRSFTWDEAYARCRRGRDKRASFHEIQLTVAHDEFVGRQIVVNIREVNRENFITQERKRLEGIKRIDGQETRQFTMLPNRFHRTIQCRHRIIGQQEPDARIVLGAALAIQRSKTIQPCCGAMSGIPCATSR